MAERNRGAIVITGASTGIGRACALLLDRAGFRVFAGVRDGDAAGRLQAEASASLTPLRLDVTSDELIVAARERISQSLNPEEGLAGLVNNAGTVISGPLECLPVERLRQQLKVDTVGHIAVTQALLPLLRRARGRPKPCSGRNPTRSQRSWRPSSVPHAGSCMAAGMHADAP